ncbi:MAG TPA: hypothetical protein VFB88_14695 [Xanthobacteraceae bacterium]|nr:hypothetical protein [Xanthobacteraceae bacterium]
MHPGPQSTASSDRDRDDVDEAALARVMNEAPKGAVAVAGAAVALLTVAWVVIYLFVFVPRGVVG